MNWFELIAPACILAALMVWLVSLLIEKPEKRLPPPAPEARRGCYDAWRHQ